MLANLKSSSISTQLGNQLSHSFATGITDGDVTLIGNDGRLQAHQVWCTAGNVSGPIGGSFAAIKAGLSYIISIKT